MDESKLIAGLEALADKYRGLRVLRQMRSASEVEVDLRALIAEAREGAALARVEGEKK